MLTEEEAAAAYAEATDGRRDSLPRTRDNARQWQRVKPDPETNPLADLDCEKVPTWDEPQITTPLPHLCSGRTDLDAPEIQPLATYGPVERMFYDGRITWQQRGLFLWVTRDDFDKIKLSETIETRDGKPCRAFHSALWQADPKKLHRMAPIEFIGRYLDGGWFDYAICDKVHQLGG